MGCMLGMPDVSLFVFIAAATTCMGFLELKKCFFKAGVFRVRRIFVF